MGFRINRIFALRGVRYLLLSVGFSLFAGVGNTTAAKASKAEPWEDYIKQHAIALQTVEAPLAPELLEKLASRELVLMGETTHGTLEYYTWRAAITRALVREADFRYIAVEGDWTALDPLDRYVRHFPDSADSAREVLARIDRWAEWMWANPVILDLAEWLRDWNGDLPPEQRVGFHGIDVYGWGDSVLELPAYLERLEAGWGHRAEMGLEPLRQLEGDIQAYARAVSRGQPTANKKLESIQQRLTEKEATWRAKDAAAFLQARQQAALIARAKEHMRRSVFQQPQSWNPRAANFMGTVLRLREAYREDARGVVWAHNTHIGDARHTPMAQSGLFTVGQQAREALGEDRVFLLGFASDRGTFRAGIRWGGPGQVIPLAPAMPGTFDFWLASAAPDLAYLPLAEARRDDRLQALIGHRAIGIVHSTGGDTSRNYVPSNVPRRYDGIVFIRETSALPELDAGAVRFDAVVEPE